MTSSSRLPRIRSALASWSCGLGEQERLRLRARVRVDLLGQRVDGADDDRGLVGQQVTGGQGSADRLVLLGVEGTGECGLAGRLGAGHPGLGGPPHRRRRRPGLVLDVAGLGLGRDGGLHPVQPGAEPGQHGQRRTQLVVAERPRRGVAQLAELGLHPREHPHDRVSRSGGGARAGHRTIAAGTTDSRGGQKRQFGGYSQSRRKQYFAHHQGASSASIWADSDEWEASLAALKDISWLRLKTVSGQSPLAGQITDRQGSSRDLRWRAASLCRCINQKDVQR